jgi:hypothetical protein
MTTQPSVLPAPRADARTLLVLFGLAAALVMARAALRGLHLPGHAALPALFVLVLARASAGRSGAAAAVAAPAFVLSSSGLAAAPGGAASLALAVLVVEVAGALVPSFVTRMLACAAVGALAGAARLLVDLPALAVGAPDPGAPALLSAAAHAAFGALGAALVPLLGGRRRPGRGAQSAGHDSVR